MRVLIFGYQIKRRILAIHLMEKMANKQMGWRNTPPFAFGSTFLTSSKDLYFDHIQPMRIIFCKCATNDFTMTKYTAFRFGILLPSVVIGFVLPSSHRTESALDTRLFNIFTDIGDALSGGKLVDQTGVSLAYGSPLGEPFESRRRLAIQERAISFTGEDFDIFDLDGNTPYCRVRGAMLHLPGKDKMRITCDGHVCATLDRKLIALTPTYDIYRGPLGEKIGWLEKAGVALTDTFEFHAQQEGGFGPFKPPAAFKLEGDFLDRRFAMKNSKGEVVAKVTKDQIIEFDQFNHYQIDLAPGMDPILVVACACAIDEEFDEEHKKRKEHEKER